MKKVAFIGAGGIMSNFVKYFTEMLQTFDKKELVYIKIFDYDSVEEKNLLRSNQNFLIDDLCLNKAEALSKRYNEFGIDWEDCKIDESTVEKLKEFDEVVMGVDNHKARIIIYDFCIKNKKWLIDMRAQGTVWGFTIVDGSKDMEYYNNTIFKNEDVNNRKGSCQLEEDVEKDNFQNANKTVAFYVANCIYLQHIRSNKLAVMDFKTMY